MYPRTNPTTRPLLSPNLLKSANELVANATSATFASDPLLGPGLSLATSVFTSVVKRHGNIIEAGIIEALELSEQYIVLPSVTMPITTAAEVLVAGNAPDALKGLSVSHDGPSNRLAVFDLVAIRIEDGHAIIVEIKRGSGETELKKRRYTENTLRAGQLQGKSFLKSLGYSVSEVNARVIDFYGRSRFRPDLAVTRTELDALFKVPVRATVDAVTAVVQRRLRSALPGLIGLVQGDEAVVPFNEFAVRNEAA